ncbi:MAG: hypothetical protein Q7T40_07845 [Methylobacter sp.]|nr:hypothetical protein [Methylobacter sp.]
MNVEPLALIEYWAVDPDYDGQLFRSVWQDYRVDGAVMNIAGYNDFLSRMTRRISQALSQPLPKGNKIAAHLR